MRSDGRFDVKKMNRLYFGLTAERLAKTLKKSNVLTEDLDDAEHYEGNALHFGDLNGCYLYSKTEAEDFVRSLTEDGKGKRV